MMPTHSNAGAQPHRSGAVLPPATPANDRAHASAEFVTIMAAGQMFGLPILHINEVFKVPQMTAIPLAPPAVRGLINLRGRVVTALCLRTLLGMPPSDTPHEQMAVGLLAQGEHHALLVDRIGEVLALEEGQIDANPIHMDRHWQSLSAGVTRLERQLLIVLDLERVLASLHITT